MRARAHTHTQAHTHTHPQRREREREREREKVTLSLHAHLARGWSFPTLLVPPCRVPASSVSKRADVRCFDTHLCAVRGGEGGGRQDGGRRVVVVG